MPESAAPAPKDARLSAPALRALKGKRRIVSLTGYDVVAARLLDEAGFDFILVGDSLANTVLGHDSTLPVTLDEMLVFTRAVARGTRRALVVGDLPFGSYHASTEQAVESAIRFVKEGGAGAVKLEGGKERADAIRAIAACGIPVMGHIGLRPQNVLAMGGYRVQGKGDVAGELLVEDAHLVAAAGAFAIVIEGVPAPLAARITAEVAIPTIGIGAGKDCDGQILVWHDLLGLNLDHSPKFVRRYAELAGEIRGALARFKQDVEGGAFPGEAESYR